MGIFNKHNSLPPLTPSDSEVSRRVLRTHELLDLDDSQMVLVGSAAMVLYGISVAQFDPIDGDHPVIERPSDLDFATSPLYMQSLYDPHVNKGEHTTPNGLPMVAKPLTNNRIGLRIDTHELPVDLLSGYRDGRDVLARFDEEFRHYMDTRSRLVEGTTMRVITPQAMQQELSKRQRTGMDNKARTDLADLRMARLR